MLKLTEICKTYRTGDLVQNALKNVSFSLRDNEFVAILGQSGSGKTTLLNVIGGLDRYDSGDLIINGVSTKQYTDRDWDSYRNHTVGFVFQSYNLIPHQTVLANVELALTISGIKPSERRRRAKEALIKVGLGDHIHKKPNQMSGGQMQRVAIARALVNDPDILLADEPTGALDSDTSVQVMDLLKEVASDRLVVMVTHNPELAAQYATRTIVLHDGVIQSDSDPYEPELSEAPPVHKNMGKASMSVLTALSLSFNNLWTKKARTLLTAFAGSIGIIGIAMILSLSNGVNTYITDIQRDTMSSYPITISKQSVDLSSMMNGGNRLTDNSKAEQHSGTSAVYADDTALKMTKNAESLAVTNNLERFNRYLSDENSPIREYIGQNGVIYTYDVKFKVLAKDGDGIILDTDEMPKTDEDEEEDSFTFTSGMMGNMAAMFGGLGGSGSATNLTAMTPGGSGELVNAVTKESYDLLEGTWPEKYSDVMLVLGRGNSLDATAMRQLGLISAEQYKEIKKAVDNGEETEISVDFSDVLGRSFYLVPACDLYEADGGSVFSKVGDEQEDRKKLAGNGIEISISGIILPRENSENANIYTALAYTNALTNYIIEYTNKSEVVTAQESDPEINVLTGLKFDTSDDDQRVKDVKEYLSNLSVKEKASMYAMLLYTYPEKMMGSLTDGISVPSFDMSSLAGDADLSSLAGNSSTLSELLSTDTVTAAMAFDGWVQKTADQQTLAALYDMYSTFGGSEPSASYEKNLEDMGFYTDGSVFDVYADGSGGFVNVRDSCARMSGAGNVELLGGRLPGAANEVIMITDAEGRMDPGMLYALGIITQSEYSLYSSAGSGSSPEGEDSPAEQETPAPSTAQTQTETPADTTESSDGSGSQSSETQSSETQSSETQSSETQSSETQSSETEPSQTQPTETQPTEPTEPSGPDHGALTDYTAAQGRHLWLLAPSDYYAAGESGFRRLSASETAALKNAGTQLTVVGVARPVDGAPGGRILYADTLETYVRQRIEASPAVNAQLAVSSVNVITGEPFEELSEEEKAKKAEQLIAGMDTETKARMYQMALVSEMAQNGEGEELINSLSGLGDLSGLSSLSGLNGINLSSYMNSIMGSLGSLGSLGNMGDEESQAKSLDKWLKNDPDRETLLDIYDKYLADNSYENNLETFGKVDYASPSSISIYADSFEDKESITRCISDYNENVEEDDKITYTDFVGLLMKSVTTIINVISYVLIAFVAVSLVVSSIMIGIITYISVLERTKEIGILRAIGSSKRNISQVFNAETFIIGLCSGVIGIGVTLLLLIPANKVIHFFAKIDTVNAILPFSGAVILIILSVVLTLIGGLIPAKKAATKDPVTALRSE